MRKTTQATVRDRVQADAMTTTQLSSRVRNGEPDPPTPALECRSQGVIKLSTFKMILKDYMKFPLYLMKIQFSCHWIIAKFPLYCHFVTDFHRGRRSWAAGPHSWLLGEENSWNICRTAAMKFVESMSFCIFETFSRQHHPPESSLSHPLSHPGSRAPQPLGTMV